MFVGAAALILRSFPVQVAQTQAVMEQLVKRNEELALQRAQVSEQDVAELQRWVLLLRAGGNVKIARALQRAQVPEQDVAEL